MHTTIKFLSIALAMLLVSSHLTYAKQTPFTLLNAQKRTITKDSLDAIQAEQAKAMVSSPGRALVFSDTKADLVIVTGPESDMLSYRIQGIRNPTLVVRAGSTLHILFVNVDDDMMHNIRVGDVKVPDTFGTVGTPPLPPSENETFSAQDIRIQALLPGKYPYFCSYRNHAKNGMRGWIVVANANASMDEMMRLASDTTGTSEDRGMAGMKMGGMNMGEMGGMNRGQTMPMTGMLRTESMSQEGSGTSWLPASSPMYMTMLRFDDWTLMLHGLISPRYDDQGGPRGASKFDAPNWGMAMIEHDVGKNGKISGDLMMSLDPITENGKGYPLLLQSGETYQGIKLVDYQHPHDLFAEVAGTYSQRFSEYSSGYIYLGYPGEPALGPPVFMHRPSAMANPNAPLSHHWMDATHITFGVATAGVTAGDWKLEGSYFNGSEPDENRYNFDPLKLNSYSGRLSFNPTNDLAFQVSTGFLNNPEGDGVSVIRTTGSAIYTRNFGDGNWWSTTAAWGENHEVDILNLEAVLLESQYTLNDWNAYFRGEYVQKTNSELNLAANPDKINDVEAVTLGMTRNLFHIEAIGVDFGAQGTYNVVPPSLDSLYLAHPLAFEVYFQIHPSLR